MKIFQEKKEKISEQILAFLYSINPRQIFTAHIAKEIARDEEFTKQLLQELQKKNLIVRINKNPKGKIYLKRARWRLSDKAYNSYRNQQPNNPI